MKTIRIFIGSSITDLELERMKLMSFIQGMNNKYHERGIFIDGYICEETPNDMRAGGSQAMHNDYISGNADATIFMFFHKAGEFTMKELELARQAFLEKGKPNVYVFFKAVNNAPDVNDEVQKAVSLVFNDYGHYYKMFDDVDTIKLELLQFFMEMLPGKGELLIKDGAVYMNGELIKDISSENIFAYKNNPDMKRLREQIESLRKLELAAAEKGDETSALRFSASRGELEKQYHGLEADILDTLIFFFEQNKKGGKADPVIAEALRQLELGNIAMAKVLIPQEELDRLAESIRKRRSLMEAALRKEEEILLSRTRVRIKTLKLDLENRNRFAEIEHAYESTYEAAKNAKDYAFIYDYGNFLYEQKNYPKAIEIAERLKHSCDNPDNCGEIADFERSALMNLLGNLYSATERPTEAEKLYLEALEVCRRLAESVSREAYEPGVAITCNNLGILYKDTGRPAEAEKQYLEALEVYRHLAERVSREAYEPYVARTCNNLGALYKDTGRPTEAEKLYLKALEIRRRLAETVSREAYEPYVARTCNNLGLLYKDTGRLVEAEKLYLEAIEVYRRLAESVSREAYEPAVAQILYNLGLFYKNSDAEQSKACFNEALSMAKWYKDVNPNCRQIVDKLS